MTDWYLLKTRTRFEPNACRHIEHPYHGGEATYLPTPEARAYLPGYMFARNFSMDCLATCFSANPRLFLVFSHIDQHKHIIMAPFLVENETLAHLQNIAQNHVKDAPIPLWQQLLGKKVRIPSGPFMGHMAKIKSISGPAGTVKLRLYHKILGKAVYLSLPLEDIGDSP